MSGCYPKANGGCGCLCTIQAVGTFSTGVPGLTVNVWTNSSKTTLVGTGTTDGSGNVVINSMATGRPVEPAPVRNWSPPRTCGCGGGTCKP